MLGRLIYVLIIAAVVLAGGFAFDFLANEQGGMIVEFGDRQWTFTLFEAGLVLALGILAILLAIWAVKIVIATVRLLLGDGAAFDGFFRKWREKRGLAALSKAMVALEAGDAKLARKKAELAERKLNNPDLTRLISAKAAEMVGDTAHAETYYKALMDDPKTAFVGARGLLNKALADGNSDRALKLARHAQSLRPKDEGTLETLYALQSRKFDWAGARKTLQLQKRAGFVPKLEAQRREAALTYAQAEDAEKAGDTPQARALAVEAARKDPGNVEAVTSAVRLLLEEGSKRAASKLVQNAWRTGPDSRLAAAYASIEPDEAPAARRRRFEVLFALQPDHRETRFLRAELALVAEDWSGARSAIADLRETEPSARSCAIMAAIARGEGEPDHVVRGWLARALGAPRTDQTDSEISNAAMLPLLIEPAATGAAPETGERYRAARGTDRADAAAEDAETSEDDAGADDMLAKSSDGDAGKDTDQDPRQKPETVG